MLEKGSPGQAVPRAFLRIGGATLAQHQLGVARALGCQHLVCLARGTDADLTALQHEAEASGMKFHILTDPKGLSAIVTARDELIVVSEGLLADPGIVAGLLGEKPCVLVQPAEGAVEAGFERIDLNYACAGVILIAGNLVENLHDLPSDCDVASVLTRVALQHGVRRHEVPAGLRGGVRWKMVLNEAEAHAIENEWLRHALGEARHRSPGLMLARGVALTLGSSLLHSGNGAKAANLSALAVLALAVGIGWIGMGLLGFLIGALAWVMVELHRMLRKVEQRLSGALVVAPARADALGWLYDLAIVFLVAWEAPGGPANSLVGRVFAPIMLILLLRIVPHNFPEIWAGWMRDRSMLALALAVAAASGFIPITTQLLAVGLAIAAIALATGKRS
jgi:hypothetical protein